MGTDGSTKKLRKNAREPRSTVAGFTLTPARTPSALGGRSETGVRAGSEGIFDPQGPQNRTDAQNLSLHFFVPGERISEWL
jgi:hypothetical protein